MTTQATGKWVHLAQDKTSGGLCTCDHSKNSSDFIQCGKFLFQLGGQFASEEELHSIEFVRVLRILNAELLRQTNNHFYQFEKLYVQHYILFECIP